MGMTIQLVESTSMLGVFNLTLKYTGMPTKISSPVNWPLIIGENRLIGTSKSHSYNKENEG